MRTLPPIACLNLTLSGTVQLQCFSDEAIRFADSHSPTTFKEFVRYARSSMESEGEYIDYEPLALMAHELGVHPLDSPVFVPALPETMLGDTMKKKAQRNGAKIISAPISNPSIAQRTGEGNAFQQDLMSLLRDKGKL